MYTCIAFLDPTIDPSTLCPWCDDVLPPEPSAHLQALIRSVREHSYNDPRPTNPLGLYAVSSRFVVVCQRHAFEQTQVPLAEQNGWPREINWDAVGERVIHQEQVLRQIIDDVDETWLVGQDDDSEDLDTADDMVEDEEMRIRRPRKGSIFWKDVSKRFKALGRNRANAVQSRFATFSETQPG